LRPHISSTTSSGRTRQLANSFGTYGLVILDADDADLKRPFIPFAKELLPINFTWNKKN
jgi:hypothetical protein